METSAQREERIRELERRTPEGEGTTRRTTRLELGVLAPIAALGLIVGSWALYAVGGPMALALGLFLVVVYYTLAWWPEIVAAFARRHDHREFVSQVDRGSGA